MSNADFFPSLATEDAGSDSSRLILMMGDRIRSQREESGAPRVPQSPNEQLHQRRGREGSSFQAVAGSSNSQSPARNDGVTVNPPAPRSETLLFPASLESKKQPVP